MTAPAITTHVADALARLAQQYVGAPQMTNLVTSIVNRIQVVEDVLQQGVTKRSLFGNTATGAQRDVIGSVAGLMRQGLDDDTYRVLIRGEIAKNNSNSTLGAVLAVAKTVFQADAVWVTSPNTFGAASNTVAAELSLAIGSPQTDAKLFDLCISIIKATLAGGISLVSITVFNSDGAFCMAGAQPFVQGPSQVDGTGGGLLGTLIYNDSNA